MRSSYPAPQVYYERPYCSYKLNRISFCKISSAGGKLHIAYFENM
jgi:hypothetical protein